MESQRERLELLNLRLRGKQKEACRADFAQFLAYCWIEDKENKRAVKFNLWDSQKKIVQLFISALLLIILKARQLGLTWLAAAYCLWLAWAKPLQLIIVISVNEDLAIEFLDRVYFILDRLPKWMIPANTIKTRTRQTLEILHQDGLISTIKSLPTTEMGAQSKTPTLLVLDETSRNRLVSEIYNASLPGIEAAKGQVIVISNSIKTAPGWGWTRDLYIASMRGDNNFRRVFLPWQAHPHRPTNFKELQLQKGMSEQDFIEHYPESEEEAIRTLGGSYFGDALGRHNETIRGLVGSLVKNRLGEYEFVDDTRGIIELWRYPYNILSDYDGLAWSKRYAIGSDISEGLGQSYSVAYVIDRAKDEIVARMRSNRIDAAVWARLLFELSKYYDNALICPERTGAGQTTVKELLNLGSSLYVRVKPDRVTKAMTKVYGWEESNASKHELSGDLRTWLKNMKGILYDAILLDECSTWIKHDNGTIGPESNKLGDCVIAAGCAVQASKFLGGPPKQGTLPTTGWLANWQKEGKSAWVQP